MSLNSNYVLLPPLQNIFRDKDTGLPLRNGYLLFFKDNQRTVGKEVFQLTGSPPNYTYTTLGHLNTDGSWQVDLDSIGSISNGVNTCNLYWYPFDDSGNVELYFVQVYDSSGVLQYSLEAEPNTTSGGGGNDGNEVAVNFVPNGQFLWHTNIQGIPPNIPNGRVQKPITDIAYGGWTFERPSGSTAQDNVVFERYGSWSATPVADPRYSCRLSCQLPDAGNSFKDLRLRFDNVNRFSSDTDYFTYGFSAVSNTGSSLTVEIVLIKNFGTGGSATAETPLGSITITTSVSNYFVSFIPGDNSGQTIGPNNDDFIQLAIRFPVDNIYDASFTDALFAAGQYTLISPPVFPETTNSQYAYRTAAGFLDIADYNSADLYLPIILTPTGLTYDNSIIGKIYPSSTIVLSKGELLCDGSAYKYTSYSTDGIPYSRLGDVIWNSTLNNYNFGTGVDFVSLSILSGATQNIKLTTNTDGLVTSTADGSSPTGFTFNTIKLGNNTYGMKASYAQSGTVYVELNTVGSIAFVPASGTTSFSLAIQRNGPSINGLIAIGNITNASLAGKYFTLSNTVTHYYVWFKVDGAGTDPAPVGLTGIEIDLLSTYSNQNVAQVIADALSGRQISNIICTAGSSVPAGSFFEFNTVTESYYAWFKVSGVGTDPAPGGRVGIQVDILSSDTNANVATKTQIAINGYQYAVPDLRGMFIRGMDDGSGNDPDVVNRFNNYSDSFGNEIGTIELDSNLSHNHQITTYGLSSYFVGDGGITVDVITSVNGNGTTAFDTDGRPESRPKNMYFQYIIKY